MQLAAKQHINLGIAINTTRAHWDEFKSEELLSIHKLIDPSLQEESPLSGNLLNLCSPQTQKSIVNQDPSETKKKLSLT